MKKFSKEETTALIIIFAVLVGISAPNFIKSLMRGRDQNRKDDMAIVQTALSTYVGDFGEFPKSTADGKILACKRPDDKVTLDKNGRLVVDLIPCEWGKDKFYDLTPGSTKVYAQILPNDPHAKDGVTYFYSSDGSRYQLFSSLESKDDVEYDKKILSKNLNCGSKVCNLGRHYACVLTKTLQQCDEESKQSAK